MSDARGCNLGLGNSAPRPVFIPLNARGETFNLGTLKLQVGQTGVHVSDTEDRAQDARMYHWRSIATVFGVTHLSARGSCEKSSVVVAEICIEIRGGEQICIKIRGGEQFNDAKRMMQSMMQIATELAALQKKAKQHRAVGAPTHKSTKAVLKKKQTSVSETSGDCERIPTYI